MGISPLKQAARYDAVVLAAAITMLLAAGLAACGGEEEARTGPDAAVEEFIQMVNRRDLGEAYDSLAASSPWRGSTRQQFITDMEDMYGDSPAAFRFSDFFATEVTIEGDRATVWWTATQVTGLKGEELEKTETSASVVREDGAWRVEVPWGSDQD